MDINQPLPFIQPLRAAVKNLIKVSVAIALSTCAAFAHADQGVVYHYEKGCDFFVIKSATGYSVSHWYGGREPFNGDLLEGVIDTHGPEEFRNLTHQAKMQVYMVDIKTSPAMATAIYRKKCGW
jgi:hypothetical protein